MARTPLPSEEELVLRARRGDDLALSALFDRHAGALKGRIGKRLSPAVRRRVSDSDVLQETLIVAAQRLDEFEYGGDGSFRRWLGGIARNTVRHAIRRHAGTAKRDVGLEVTRGPKGDHAAVPATQPTPSRVVMERELRARVSAALASMAEDHAAIIQLLEHRRVTIAEAAELMDRSPNAIKKLHARALADLAARLGVTGRGSP